ncbi:MAG: type II toxin-antitoxin system Phd/YefM family antitoxin [Sulfuritalea sp.]|jgi:prevent-host-death family protein|nr:type II toxin-antitoxin system Phd/YefM family antitoxin [Sulfuritalea sp.]MDP1982500.1 type II toxin-antitoxin system Phd/YefM family antitoxin [Sulfuritalea sp.]
MHGEWQLQQAKNGFSQLIKEAIGGSPQRVTLHGKPAAVVVSADEYERLTKRNKGKLSAALLKPEIGGDDIDFGRDRDTGRDTVL